jgi:hypothetical protein
MPAFLLFDVRALLRIGGNGIALFTIIGKGHPLKYYENWSKELS